MSKRRKGFPSETQVKRGRRIVHGDKELSEKLEQYVHRSDLGEAEKNEEKLIKKEKLALKDQMLMIAAKYQTEIAKLSA